MGKLMRILRDSVVKTSNDETAMLPGGTIVMLLDTMIDVKNGSEYYSVYAPSFKQRYIVPPDVMVNI